LLLKLYPLHKNIHIHTIHNYNVTGLHKYVNLEMPQKTKFSHASDVSSIVPGLVHVHTPKIKSNTGVGNLFLK